MNIPAAQEEVPEEKKETSGGFFFNVKKSLKEDPHSRPIALYLGLTTVLVFLVVISLVPQINQRLGIFSQRKEEQQSFAQEEEEKFLTAELLATNQKYLTAQGKVKGKLLQQLSDLSQKRKDKLLSLMEENPAKVLEVKIGKEEKEKFPPNIQKNIEEEISLEGTLEILHQDDFENQKSRNFYFLVKDKEKYSLHNADPWPSVLSGSKVRVKGLKLDTKIAFNMKETLEVLEAASLDTLGEQRTVVILANFQDTPLPSFTAEQANTMVFTSVNNFYTENSYNKVSLSGNVFGWYTMPINRDCDLGQIREKAIQAADPEVYFPDFKRLIIFVPVDVSCNNGGGSSIGKGSVQTADGVVTMSVAWVSTNRSDREFVTAHELGHSFGNHHASFLDCGNETVTIGLAGCSISEYGDPYDVMDGRIFHFNAPHKEYVGWFEPTNIQTVTTNGRYALEPIETATSNLKALKLQRSSSDYIYVEYRQPIGFDDVSFSTNIYDGGLIHSLLIPNKSALLDPTPLDTMSTITLTPGLSFTDPATGMALSVVSVTPSLLTVSVTLGKIDFTSPTVSITSPANDSIISGTTTISADASDASGIQKVEFYNGGSLIATDFDAPYSIAWDTTQVSDGKYQLRAGAYDRSGEAFGVPGNFQFSSSVNVRVNNSGDLFSPTVSITAPSSGQILKNPVTASASATDNVGVTKVEFWRHIMFPPIVDTTEPFSVQLPTLSDGNHTVWAKAFDAAGFSTESEHISFIVSKDTDGDGFLDYVENYLGTDPNRACPQTATANDESLDPWPPDFNDNGKVEIDDAFFVSSRFNAKEGDANYTKRAELASQDGYIGIDDVNAVASRFNQTCSP